jgi:protoporphyrinogen oxidase
MKIAIIGAGFTGLSAGLKLAKAGHEVIIFEKESIPGGLAASFKDPKWQWALEKYYHHCFTNDKNILDLAREIGHPILVKFPKTTVYVNDKFYKLDSPIDVLKFPELNFLQRLRMGVVIALLRYNPFWKLLEKYRVSTVLPKLMGKKPYETLWKPLIIKKFGPYASSISLAWFWARIAKRTPSLAYPQGGFLELAKSIVSEIKKNKGEVLFNSEIKKISIGKNEKININNLSFDKAIVTLPSSSFINIASQLPNIYKERFQNLKWLGTVNLVLRLKKPFFKDSTYWLNICMEKYPITAIVEHTNLIEKKYYNNEHLLYVGNYLPNDHPFMQMDKDNLLKKYDVLLKKINSEYKSSIIQTHLFSDYFAQPIVPTNYSNLIPPFETPLKNVYLANMQQIYPWDRGTNYAVELGEKIASIILDQ